MKASIVVGLGFGDEGKGVVTSSLVAESDNPMVVRFNGGHQAGHTVVKNGYRHVFSSFGSGTLHGAPTYWSQFCTVYPKALLKEFELLKQFNPILYIDPLCPITTPFDVTANQKDCKDGSVGVGFGKTLQRQQDHYTLFAKDLKYNSVLKIKLDQIINYYQLDSQQKTEFLLDVEEMLSLENIRIGRPQHKGDFIFEGAQGILLDQTFGFFPHVTRSNTTSKNALSLIDRNVQPTIYLITRAYQTRHGNGPMTGEPINLKNNKEETNVTNTYQGNFRTSTLDLDLINYAIECENIISGNIPKKIIMTCCDQVDQIPEIKATRLFSPETVELELS